MLERSIYSDFVFLEAMYKQGFIRRQCESRPGRAPGWSRRARVHSPSAGVHSVNVCHSLLTFQGSRWFLHPFPLDLHLWKWSAVLLLCAHSLAPAPTQPASCSPCGQDA